MVPILGSERISEKELVLKNRSWDTANGQILTGSNEIDRATHTVFSDRKGVLWFGGETGLFRHTGHITRAIQLPEFLREDGTPRPIIDLIQHRDHAFLYALTGDGVIRFRPLLETAQWFPCDQLDPDAPFLHFAQGAADDIWITSPNGLFHLDQSGEYRKLGKPESTGELGDLLVDRDKIDRVWITDRTRGLVSYDSSLETWKSFDLRRGEKDGRRRYQSLIQGSDNTLWVGGRNILVRFQPSDLRRSIYRLPESRKAFLQELTDFHIDEVEQDLWIATQGGRSLLTFDIVREEVFQFVNPIRYATTKQGLDTQRIHFDESGTIWLATSGDGIVRINRDDAEFTVFSHRAASADSLHNGKVTRVIEISGDEFYVHSSLGISKVNTKTGTTSRITESLGEDEAACLDIYRDRDGTIYGLFARRIAKLVQPHDQKPSWETVISYNSSHKFSIGSFADTLDPQGYLWFVVDDRVRRFSPSSGSVKEITKLPHGHRTETLAICPSYVWFAASEHLIRIDLKTLKETGFDLEEGLHIKDLLWDCHSSIFVASNFGLHRVNPVSGETSHFRNVQFPISSIALGTRNDIWLTTKGKLRKFDRQNESVTPFPAQNQIDTKSDALARLQRVSEGRLVTMGWAETLFITESELLSQHVPRPRPLVLSYAEVVSGAHTSKPVSIEKLRNRIPVKMAQADEGIRLQFDLLDYRNIDQNQFHYSLNGAPPQKAYRGLVELSNLPGGKNVLTVTARSSTFMPAANQYQVQIVSTPPFWKSSVFYLLIVAAVLGIGMLLQSFRNRIVRQSKDRLLEAHIALKSSESSYRRIFEDSSDTLAIISQDLEILTLNAAGKSLLFGAERDEKQYQRDLHHLADLPDELEKLIAKAQAGGIVHDEPLGLTSTDDRKISTLLSLSCASDDSGTLQMQLRDITEKAELETRIQQTQRMEAVGTLAGGIAHDFNNLLSPILVHTRLAIHNITCPEEVDPQIVLDGLNTCEEAAQKAALLVRDLLQFARRTDHGDEEIEVISTVRNAVRLLRGGVASHIQIEIHTEIDEAWVQCSSQRLEQALLNLGVNASHAIGIEAGRIDITIRPAADDAATWEIEIADTGSGMDEEVRRRVFEPFFTTKDVGEGTGLGLAMVHSFVKEAEGNIEVASRPGEGTQFQLRLPAIPSPIVEKATPFRPGIEPQPASQPGGRLLVIDDDIMVLKATSMILQKSGYAVESLSDPQEAIDYFRKHHDEIDAVVSDQMMPGITGLDVAERIKEIRAEIPVILLTGYSEVLLEKGANRSLVEAIHMKPLDYQDLNRTLQTVLGTEAVALSS